MSDVKRYIPEGYTQPASRSGTGTHMVESRDGDYVLAFDYDALAQRCRELEDYIDNHSAITADYIARLQRTMDERDTLRAEVEQLRKDAERYRGVRRVAAAHGYTEERFDEQTDRKIARFDAAMRNEQ